MTRSVVGACHRGGVPRLLVVHHTPSPATHSLLEQKAAAAAAVSRHVVPLLADGRMTVPVQATVPMADAAAAYERFRAGGKFGKIVLEA